jgi:hypothetical protein
MVHCCGSASFRPLQIATDELVSEVFCLATTPIRALAAGTVAGLPIQNSKC